jgi:hypothetical protein
MFTLAMHWGSLQCLHPQGDNNPREVDTSVLRVCAPPRQPWRYSQGTLAGQGTHLKWRAMALQRAILYIFYIVHFHFE